MSRYMYSHDARKKKTNHQQNFCFTICKWIRQINIHMSEVHRGSAVEFGRALPGYPITAHHLYASLR